MRKLKCNSGAKATAIVLLCVLVVAFILSIADIAIMDSFGVYPDNYERGRRRVIGAAANMDAYSNAWYYLYDGDETMLKTNIRYVITRDGEEVFNNLPEGEMAWNESYTIRWYGDTEELTTATDAMEATFIEPERIEYKVQAYVPAVLTENDRIFAFEQLYNFGYNLRYASISIAALSFIAGVLLYIFLLSAAGHRTAEGEIHSGFTEKVPFDLFTFLIVAAICLCLLIIGEAFGENVVVLALCILLLLAAGLCFLWWSMSLAIRIKAGTLWKNTIIAKVLGFVLCGGKKIVAVLRELIGELPHFVRGLVIVGVLLFIGFNIFMSYRHQPIYLTFLWFLEKLLLSAGAIYLLWCWVKLRNGARAVANGDLGASVNTASMFGELKSHGEDINNIRGGISHAVEERIKSERFRTELITNVSHDIKTPLTSIISYVDLMEKEEPENEKMREYLEVLERQSARLKKLIDDLLEASKASTGNLTVSLAPCELGVLLEQTAGEYQERLESKGLVLVTQKSDSPVTVMADGKHLWRIFDNLMNNILKYAQSGTRVYLTLESRDRQGVITFRNISRNQLSQSSEELMERFVRGDVSRNSEGNGLGLSIARSLAELQNGTLELAVDGDLFKVTLSFPMV